MNKAKLYQYYVLKTPCNKITFEDFLNEFFIMLKQDQNKRILIIMDNLPFHHATNIYSLICFYGHQVIFLPPYSPQFNPIENLFSQWKNIVRQCNPKNEKELFEAINSINNHLTSEQCSNYVQHAVHNMLKCLNNEDMNQY